MEAFTKKLSADVGRAYICTTSSTDFKLTSGNSTVNVSLSDIEFQPFEVHNGHLGERKCIIFILELVVLNLTAFLTAGFLWEFSAVT